MAASLLATVGVLAVVPEVSVGVELVEGVADDVVVTVVWVVVTVVPTAGVLTVGFPVEPEFAAGRLATCGEVVPASATEVLTLPSVPAVVPTIWDAASLAAAAALAAAFCLGLGADRRTGLAIEEGVDRADRFARLQVVIDPELGGRGALVLDVRTLGHELVLGQDVLQVGKLRWASGASRKPLAEARWRSVMV